MPLPPAPTPPPLAATLDLDLKMERFLGRAAAEEEAVVELLELEGGGSERVEVSVEGFVGSDPMPIE